MAFESGAQTAAWEWPICPRCGKRRSARCPVCGASKIDFQQAHRHEHAAEPLALLICDDCDDVFTPDWYRLCAACGYDFGDGIEPQHQASDITASRAWWMIVVVLMAGALALAAYFSWLFSQRAV